MVFIAPPFLSDAFLLPLLLPLPYGTIVKNVVSKKTDSKQKKRGILCDRSVIAPMIY